MHTNKISLLTKFALKYGALSCMKMSQCQPTSFWAVSSDENFIPFLKTEVSLATYSDAGQELKWA